MMSRHQSGAFCCLAILWTYCNDRCDVEACCVFWVARNAGCAAGEVVVNGNSLLGCREYASCPYGHH
jgi:hypothetical protein